MRLSNAATAALVLFVAAAVSACGETADTEMADTETDAGGWEEFTFADLKIAKDFPAEPARTEGTYWEWPLTEDRDPEVAGEAPSTILTASADNIDYEVTAVPLPDRIHMGASVMGECAYLTEESGVETKNTFIEIDNGSRPVYGQQVSVDRHDGMGRMHNGCFFENGIFYLFSATVHPEHGDLDAEEAQEFIASGRFLDDA